MADLRLKAVSYGKDHCCGPLSRADTQKQLSSRSDKQASLSNAAMIARVRNIRAKGRDLV